MKFSIYALFALIAHLLLSNFAIASQSFETAPSQVISKAAFQYFPTASLNGWIRDRQSLGDTAPDYLLLNTDGSLDVIIHNAIPKPPHLPRARQTTERISLVVKGGPVSMSTRCTSFSIGDFGEFLELERESGAIARRVNAPRLPYRGKSLMERSQIEDMLTLRCSIPNFIASEFLAEL